MAKKYAGFLVLLSFLLIAQSVLAEAAPGGEEVAVPQISNVYQKEIPDNEAMAFLKKMGFGWNLGNTFDAYGRGGARNEMNDESMWVGVRTTEAMIAAVHDAGFTTLRIPVSWHNHVSADDFTISAQWLDRVQQVADWAIQRGMYVILNTHHDEGYDYFYPLNAYYEGSEKYITAIWGQVADRFAAYDEHLIFESMNEPRLKDHANEWWFDAHSADCLEAADCINRLNQAFVDTVRAAGGNNATRYLMVPGYDASPDGVLRDQFVMPMDTADNRIIVSVHAYTPYSFALQDGGTARFAPAPQQTTEIAQFMNGLYNKYIVNGIPVVIGEFGARDKNGNLQDRVNFAAYYAAFASIRNLPVLWWDNNAFTGSGENFGLLRRQDCSWRYPQIVEALQQYAGYDKMPVLEQ
ncbi:MAG: glycoside hydrolase family 5 protein [Clostridia bacterium]|nr:glycoside hydrolase family 5 protein [Clostridia bacterium]